MQHVLWYDKVHHDLLLGNKLLKIRGRAVRLISPFPSLRLLMSAFCWFALMPHVAAPCISCIIPRTPSKDREDGRWQSGPAPRRALRLEGYYTFFFSFCRSALLFRLRAVRELQVAETKGPNYATLSHFCQSHRPHDGKFPWVAQWLGQSLSTSHLQVFHLTLPGQRETIWYNATIHKMFASPFSRW